MNKYIVKALQKYTSYQIFEVEIKAPSIAIAKIKVLNDHEDLEPIDIYDTDMDEPEFTDIDKWEVTKKDN